MDFRVLGPLEVWDGECRVRLAGGQLRKLLGILVVHANEVVASEQLIDALWVGSPPETAAKALQGHIAQLRKLIGPGVLVTESPGYVLRVDLEAIDAHRFARLLAEARHAPPAEAARQLREALALRRGRPLADFAYDEFAREETLRLEELELEAIEARIEADLELGRHAALVGELDALVSSHPLRERLRGQQMLALYRSGRQADALEAYQGARKTLVDDLGLEPSEDLQQLQRAILVHDPALLRPSADDLPRGRGLRSRLRHPRTLAGIGLVLLASAAAAVVLESTAGTRPSNVLVRANSVGVVDPRTAHLVGDIAVGGRPVAITVAYGAVWVANANDGTITRIDSRTRKVVETIGVGFDVSDIEAGFGSIWVADGNDGTITRVDPSSNSIQATLTLGHVDPVAADPVFFLAVDRRFLWATRGSRLLRIAPATNTVKSVGIGSPVGLTTGGGATWVTTLGERLLRIQPERMTVSDSISLPGAGISPVFSGGSLWLILGRGVIVRIDPTTLAPTATALVGGTPTSLAAGPKAIWVSNADGIVSRIDSRSATVTATDQIGRALSALAVADGGVWVTAEASGS